MIRNDKIDTKYHELFDSSKEKMIYQIVICKVYILLVN